MSTRTNIGVVLALLVAGCQGGASRYDEGASRAYRAAWDLRRTGDEAGYKRGLEAVAKQRGTWAGDRAAMDLERAGEKGHGSFLRQLLERAGQVAAPAAPPEPVEPTRAVDSPPDPPPPAP